MLGSPSGPALPLPPGSGIAPAVERPSAQPPYPRPWWRRNRVVIPAALVVAVAVTAVVIVATVLLHRGPQAVLPFTGLSSLRGVAVDAAGNVYVVDNVYVDSGSSRVVKLAAGSSTQTVLPFTGLKDPWGVAVDAAGSVYVADTENKRVVKLAAGASTQTVLPFTGLVNPEGVAVDAAGSVYVAMYSRVVKLAAG
jgi:serine/threonine protein kinase, bacterial